MQAMMVAGPKPGISAGVAPGVGAESDVPLDFAALLMAQMQGDVDPSLPLDVEAAAETAILPLDDATQDVKAAVAQELMAGVVVDPAQQIMPSVVGFSPAAKLDQPTPVDLGRESSGALAGIQLAEENRAFALPDVVAAGQASPGNDLSSAWRGKVAEFAVDGKPLPESVGGKNAEGLKPLSPDVLHLPESAPSAVPMMLSANQAVSIVETRNAATVVQVPVGKPGWDDALGQKVVWMAGQQQQVAELHLNPPNLGPMEIRLSISNDQVSALFVSHQPAVREAIEAAMPRLREMFAESGMMLGNASVTSDSLPQQQASEWEGRSGAASRSGFTDTEKASVPLDRGVSSLRGIGLGRVDLFA